MFNLPHPSSIRNWTSSVNCEPVFHREVLSNLAQQMSKDPSMTDCTLMVDGMAIRKQVLYDHKNAKYSGFVDYFGIAPERSEEQVSSCWA